jgi:hypothetical protein
VDVFPPKELAKLLLAAPDRGLPVLDSIVAAPVFDADGALIATPGYHPDSRLWYHQPRELELGEIPEQPAPVDVETARAWLLDEVLGEFPFVADADRAHALGGMLLPFVRRLIRGCTPLHLFEAPVPSSGKTYLTELANVLIEGVPGQSIRVTLNDEENAKILFAKLLRAPTILRLDNLKGGIDSAILAEILTANGEWESRVLGQSTNVSLPVRCAWWATANNPKLSTEVTTRTVRIRLNPKLERPDRRCFRRPDLLGWVTANRGRILSALFLLVRHWLAQGSPGPAAGVSTRYKAWEQVIGGILHASGVTGFMANQDELYEVNDEETASWTGFTTAWWERFGGAWLSVAELYRLADPGQTYEGQEVSTYLDQYLQGRTEKARQVALGIVLQAMHDRVFGGRLIQGRRNTHSKRWEYRLQPMETVPGTTPTQRSWLGDER